MKKSLLMVSIAGLCASTVAMADDAVLNYPTIQKTGAVGGYNSRDNLEVFGIEPPGTGDWRSRGGAHMCGSRFSFTPGPAAGVTPVNINGLGFAVDQTGTAGAPQDAASSFTMVIRIYSDPEGGPAVDPTALPATPTATITGDFASFCTPGYITFYPGTPIGITPTLALPTGTGFYNITIYNYQDQTTLNPEVGPTIRGLTLPVVGSTNGARWADADNNGVYAASEGFGDLTNPRCVYLNLQADVPPPPPPGATDLGCLTDAGLNRNSESVANGATNWYQFCLNGDATVDARQFLSFDTNGSAADMSMAIYATNGQLVGQLPFDADSGDGAAAQMSWGIGRMAGVGDGNQYDGVNGDLLAGSYYLAVSGAGANFGGSFNVTPGATGGSYQLHARTNTNGGALPNFVEPTLRSGNDLGALSDPGAPGTDYTLPRYTVDFYKFQVCVAAEGDYYLDIDYGSTVGLADPEAVVFDSGGNAIATSDDAGASYNKPQFSWGNAGPRTHSSPVDFDGSTAASLPAGTYYLGTGLYHTYSSGDRFDLHSNSGSSLTYHVDFYTNLPLGVDCNSGGGCPPCAADFNQDGGVDGSDVEAFFITWESGDPCGDTDLDGGVTGSDVEAFYVAWEAGDPTCGG